MIKTPLVPTRRSSKLEKTTPGFMKTSRLEAFSDGVIAIIITIMVLDLRVPHGPSVAALRPMLPVLLCYVLSFIYVGIYWNNHHHLFQAVERVNGVILWSNLHLLFWLSLFPFVTGWMGENHFEAVPSAFYGCVLLMAAVAWYILQRVIIVDQGGDSPLAGAIGLDWKGAASMILYAVAIPSAFVGWWIAAALYVAVAAIWFIPDRRIERVVAESDVS